MNRDFVVNHFLPALFLLVIGVAVSGGTLSYFRGQTFGVATLGVVFYVMGFLLGSMLLAAAAWTVGYATVGNLGRKQFQIVWVVVAAIVQLLIAALSTYDLHQLGVFSLSDMPRTMPSQPIFVLLCVPYATTVYSLKQLFKTYENDADRTLRLASLQRARTEYAQAASAPRPSALMPVVICTFLLFAIVWCIFGVQRENITISALLGAIGGLMFGLFIHSMRPAQRRLSKLKSVVEAFKK